MKQLLFAISLLISSVITAQTSTQNTVMKNSVMSFDGVDDYIELGDSVANDVRTIEMWFQPKTAINSSLSDFSYLIVREIGPVNHNEFHISFRSTAVSNTGALQFMIRDGNNRDYRVLSNSKSWNIDQWYHLAGVVDPIKGMMLFIDGVKQIDTNSSTIPITSVKSATTIGGTTVFLNRYFHGNIDDVRFSTAAEYSSNFTPPCPDLKATASTSGLWNFNDSTAVDSSGNLNNGTIQGAVGIQDDVCESTVASDIMSFDGVDDYVDLGNSVATGTRTIELWFKPSDTINSTLSDFSTLVAREISLITNADEFNVAFAKQSSVTNAGALQFIMRDANNIRYAVVSNNNVWNSNQWYHVAAVIDSIKGMMLFVDGIKQNDTNAYSSAIVANSNYTAVGCWGKLQDRYFNGSIDDVRFSTAAEYSSNFTPPCPDLTATHSTVGLWNFNENSNSIVAVDSSGNANHGDIFGAIGDTATICKAVATSVVEHTTTKQAVILVYPNPSNGRFTFKLEDLKNISANRELRIFDYSGKLIESRIVSHLNETIDLSNFSKGLYFYQLISGSNELYSGKLIKQ